MKKSERLLTLIKLKQREEEALAKSVAEIAGLLESEKGQFEDLKSYKAEYLQELNGLVTQTISMSTLLTKQHFITKLDQAVSNQQARLDQIQREWTVRVQRWGQKKQEISTWERMIQEAKNQEELAKDKIQQKELDDLHASRRRRF